MSCYEETKLHARQTKHRGTLHIYQTLCPVKKLFRNLKNMHSGPFVFVLARNIHLNFLEGSGHTSPPQIHNLLKPRVHEFEKPEKETVSKYLPRLAQLVCHKICIHTETQKKKTQEN